MADYKWDNDTLSTDAPWWDYHDQITSVVIGDSVTHIGDLAFSDCSDLTSVALGKRVKTIGAFAFSGCDLRTLDLPLSLQKIDYCGFSHNFNLTLVDFKGNLETIGNQAFYYCSISELKLPDSLKTVGRMAFEINDFKSVVIPESVTSIGDEAFGYGLSDPVEGFIIYGWPDTEAEYYAGINGFTFVPISGETGDCTWSFDPSTGTLTVSGEGRMKGYYNDDDDFPPWYDFREQITGVVIGDGVTNVGGCAFAYCNTITTVSLGKTVREIGWHSFRNCDLREVTIPDSVESIEFYAFFGNSNLSDLNLNSEIEMIGQASFFACNLGDVVIPDSVKTIEYLAFCGNPNMSSITLGRKIETIENYAFGYGVIEEEGTFWPYHIDDFTVYGYEGTAAQEYANEKEFEFISLGYAVKIGDVNGDGAVDVLDANMIQKYAVDKITLTDSQKYAADVNNDGTVDVLDANMIQKYAVDKIDHFPKETFLEK